MKKILAILIVMMSMTTVAFAMGGRPNKYSTCIAATYAPSVPVANRPAMWAECSRLYVDCNMTVTTKGTNKEGGKITLTTCKQI